MMKKKWIFFFLLFCTAGYFALHYHYDVAVKDQDDVQIQFFQEMMTYKNISTMATQGFIDIAAMQGASMANSYLTEQAQMLSEKINHDSQVLQNNIQAFQVQTQTHQQKILQNLMVAFSNAQQEAQKQAQLAQKTSNLELDYIHKSISLEQPQQNYIFNQISFDQMLSSGTMLTPGTSLWYNPFSIGNWQFDKDSNSFWQYQNSPVFTTTPDNQTPSAQQVENNSIFTEYFTTEESYTISVDITIHQTSFPGFVGIMFNKSRWISGDFQAIRKCRLCGIYARSFSDIGLYCTEQFVLTDDQLKQTPNADAIQTPLQQIITARAKKQATVPAEVVKNLPIKLTLQITNSAQNATIQLLSHNTDMQPITITKKWNDPKLYMYHGIGFMSPGIISQFTINQPTALVFNQQDLELYRE